MIFKVTPVVMCAHASAQRRTSETVPRRHATSKTSVEVAECYLRCAECHILILRCPRWRRGPVRDAWLDRCRYWQAAWGWSVVCVLLLFLFLFFFCRCCRFVV